VAFVASGGVQLRANKIARDRSCDWAKDGQPTEINRDSVAYAAVGAEGKDRQLPNPERDHLFG
jgi:hypothetical protein